MNATDAWCVFVHAHPSKHTQTKHVTHKTVHGNVYITGGHMHIKHKSIMIMYNKRLLLMYCHISLNRPTVAATGRRRHIIHVLSCLCRNLHDKSVFWKLEKKTLFHVLLGLLFRHKLSHFKFEIHVVMHLSQRYCKRQNINLSSQMRWLLKGMVELPLVYCTLRLNTPTDFRPSHIRFAPGARAIYLPS